jgi:hypothetical protein
MLMSSLFSSSAWKIHLVESFVRVRCDLGHSPESDEIIRHALSRLAELEKEEVVVKEVDDSPLAVLRRLNQTLRLGATPGKPTCYTWGSSYFYQTEAAVAEEKDEKKKVTERTRMLRRMRRRTRGGGALRTTLPRMVTLARR